MSSVSDGRGNITARANSERILLAWIQHGLSFTSKHAKSDRARVGLRTLKIGSMPMRTSTLSRTQVAFLVLSAICLTWVGACGGKSDEPQINKPQPVGEQEGARQNRTAATGTIAANPHPIVVCDGKSGSTTLSWTTTGATLVEVRVGKPDGDLFARTGSSGSAKTGSWVGTGMVFYLQDVSDNRPLTAENTIARFIATVTREGCP